MPKTKGHVITWNKDGIDHWEFVDTGEMFVYIYDRAVRESGKAADVFVFQVSHIYNLKEAKEFADSIRGRTDL